MPTGRLVLKQLQCLIMQPTRASSRSSKPSLLPLVGVHLVCPVVHCSLAGVGVAGLWLLEGGGSQVGFQKGFGSDCFRVKHFLAQHKSHACTSGNLSKGSRLRSNLRSDHMSAKEMETTGQQMYFLRCFAKLSTHWRLVGFEVHQITRIVSKILPKAP